MAPLETRAKVYGPSGKLGRKFLETVNPIFAEGRMLAAGVTFSGGPMRAKVAVRAKVTTKQQPHRMTATMSTVDA